ncbi:MAG TPA: hypothetical protein VN461_12335 [Vicinamibacteria bacterium]|jgi:hypothetical protein|nr:hypothetical protein [Vicinamibacteria bacterium]
MLWKADRWYPFSVDQKGQDPIETFAPREPGFVALGLGYGRSIEHKGTYDNIREGLYNLRNAESFKVFGSDLQFAFSVQRVTD